MNLEITGSMNPQELELAKFLKFTATDDLLLEIFLRLPDYLSVLDCSYVCRRWRRVIGHPKFSDMFKRRLLRRFATPMPFTLLLRRNGYSFRRQYSNNSRLINSLTLFSSKALLRRLRRDASDYLDFLPDWRYSIVKASCNDLLLVELSQLCLCVCNPVTRRMGLLPDPRQPLRLFDGHTYALSCDPRLGGGFRVALFKRTSVSVFSSETWEWGEYLPHPPAPEEGLSHMNGKAAVGDGVVYSPLAGAANGFILRKLVAFDPFDPSGRTRAVGLPGGFKGGWRGTFGRARIWVVRGQLRLWQAYWDKLRNGGSFIFKLWELRLHHDEWIPLQDLALAAAGDVFTRQSLVLALHPEDDHTFYFKDDRPILWQYHIGSGRSQKINCKISSSTQFSYKAFPLLHPRWPTDVSR